MDSMKSTCQNLRHMSKSAAQHFLTPKISSPIIIPMSVIKVQQLNRGLFATLCLFKILKLLIDWFIYILYLTQYPTRGIVTKPKG